MKSSKNLVAISVVMLLVAPFVFAAPIDLQHGERVALNDSYGAPAGGIRTIEVDSTMVDSFLVKRPVIESVAKNGGQTLAGDIRTASFFTGDANGQVLAVKQPQPALNSEPKPYMMLMACLSLMGVVMRRRKQKY